MKSKTPKTTNGLECARLLTDQHDTEIQPYRTVVNVPIGLAEKTRQASVENLNQLLADTMALRDMYKKHHWQVAGPTFYQLHLLYDKHHTDQSGLVDLLAERVQTLGGVAIAMAHDVAETTSIPRLPRGRQNVPIQLARLLHAHEVILFEARSMARRAAELGDDGTNDLIVSDVIRTGEIQVWFLSEHLANVPLLQES